jgi:hypothetical protein
MTVPVDVQSVGMSLNPTPNIPELSRWTSSGGRKQREQCIGRPHHGQGISKRCEQPFLTEMRNPHLINPPSLFRLLGLSHHRFAVIVVPKLTMNPILADCIIFHIYIIYNYNIYNHIYIEYRSHMKSHHFLWSIRSANRRCWEDGAPGMKPKAQFLDDSPAMTSWNGNQPLDPHWIIGSDIMQYRCPGWWWLELVLWIFMTSPIVGICWDDDPIWRTHIFAGG